jgi:peptidoglycan/LPS O-acetylase OafA/YrhL
MPSFFLMSGHFARKLTAKAGLAGFVRHRVRRILLPYAAALPLSMASLWWLWEWAAGRAPALGLPAAGVQAPGAVAVLPRWPAGGSPGHLWYLHYLVLLSALAALALALDRRTDRGAGDARGEAAAPTPAALPAWLPLALAVPTALPLVFMPPLRIETPLSFVPELRLLAFYGLFFAFGWRLARGPSAARLLAARARGNALACALSLPAVLLLLHRFALAQAPPALPLRLALAWLTGAFCWVATFAFVGLLCARARAGAPGPALGYLADASYWVYLVHLPVVVLAQILIAPLAAPGPLKYAAVLACALGAALASYRLCVRHTWIGALLHGPRPPWSGAGEAAA